jgi:hypothetical protein
MFASHAVFLFKGSTALRSDSAFFCYSSISSRVKGSSISISFSFVYSNSMSLLGAGL